MLALSKRIVSSDPRAEQGLPVGPPNTVRNESWNAIVVRNRRVDRYLLLPITCCCSNVFEIIADLLSLLHLEIDAAIFRPVKIVGYFYSSIGLMVSRHKALSVCVPKGTPTWVCISWQRAGTLVGQSCTRPNWRPSRLRVVGSISFVSVMPFI